MEFVEIKNKSELHDIIDHRSWDSKDYSFLEDENYNIHASIKFHGELYFVVSRTVSPTILHKLQNGTIFEKLRYYGESKKYKRIINADNKIVADGKYLNISDYGNDLLLTETENGMGLLHLIKGVICPNEYDQILPVNEFVYGVVKNDSIGFMDLFGHIVVPVNYIYKEYRPNFFSDGCVYVEQYSGDSTLGFYIDHYNNCISEKKYIHDIDFSHSPLERDEDKLDAYEGDVSNMWNTD